MYNNSRGGDNNRDNNNRSTKVNRRQSRSNGVAELNEKYKKEYPKGTPFVVACQQGNLEDVKAFIAHDSEVVNQLGKACGGYEYTGLGAAAAKGHTKTIELLLENGENIHAKDKDGKIPLDYLCEYGKCENRHFSEGSATAKLFKPKE